MDMSKEYKGVASAALDFFGKHPDGRAFIKEWHELTQVDREEIKIGLVKMGYKIAG